MSILFLEDSADLRSYTAEFLAEDLSVQVAEKGAIDRANEYLREHTGEIQCIVTDLNMDDKWLGEYQNESDGCLLSGWVWLRRFVWERMGLDNIPCVIYSGYVDFLKDYLKNNPEAEAVKEQHTVAFVRKGATDYQGYSGLLDTINRLGVL